MHLLGVSEVVVRIRMNEMNTLKPSNLADNSVDVLVDVSVLFRCILFVCFACFPLAAENILRICD